MQNIHIYIAIQYFMYVCIIAYLRQYQKTPCQNCGNFTMIKTWFKSCHGWCHGLQWGLIQGITPKVTG